MKFTLNHKIVSIPDEQKQDRLLWVLRDRLSLFGPKFGCGIGECGACSIHLNGEVVRSCSLQLGDVENQNVVTLEGLAQDGKLHPVQSAWIDENVPQCGYCQNGQIMTAVAVLDAAPGISDQELAEAMDGVRCRCGTQPRIKKALSRVRNSARNEANHE